MLRAQKTAGCRIGLIVIGCAVVAMLLQAPSMAGEKRGGSDQRGDETNLEPDAPHHGIKRYAIGQGPRSYWIYEPLDPKPAKAPVVVFLHGWFAVNPGFYGAWIDHLVRNGRTVIFPRYQNDVGTLPLDFLPNAVSAIRDALSVLDAGHGHVRPDRSQFALIGHSAGGTLAVQIAALAANPENELPVPIAVIAVMPGEVLPMRKPSLGDVHRDTLLIITVGEEDLIVGDFRARQIFRETTAIPNARKRFILFRSDRHGYPPLIAEHAAPTGAHRRLDNGEGIFRFLQLSFGEVNAHDRAGFWKITDWTLQAAAMGQTLDDVVRDEERFRHLGFWSDGRKVIPPIVGVDLDAIPRVIPSNGLKLFPLSSPKALAINGDRDSER